MKDRIRRIIEQEGLSQSEFALKLGVQRSNISHILSGRNKPSIDFIQKLLHSFPNINSEWLILGTGKMYKEDKQIIETEKITPKNTETDSNKKEDTKNNNSQVTNNNKENIKQDQGINQILGLPEQILVLYDDQTFITYKKRS